MYNAEDILYRICEPTLKARGRPHGWWRYQCRTKRMMLKLIKCLSRV